MLCSLDHCAPRLLQGHCGAEATRLCEGWAAGGNCAEWQATNLALLFHACNTGKSNSMFLIWVAGASICNVICRDFAPPLLITSNGLQVRRVPLHARVEE